MARTQLRTPVLVGATVVTAMGLNFGVMTLGQPTTSTSGDTSAVAAAEIPTTTAAPVAALTSPLPSTAGSDSVPVSADPADVSATVPVTAAGGIRLPVASQGATTTAGASAPSTNGPVGSTTPTTARVTVPAPDTTDTSRATTTTTRPPATTTTQPSSTTRQRSSTTDDD